METNWKELIGKRILVWQRIGDVPEMPLLEVELLEIFIPENQSSLLPEPVSYLRFRRPAGQVMQGFEEFWTEVSKVKLCGVLDKA